MPIRDSISCSISGSFHVGLSCHDIQATQGAKKSGVYLIHPPNLSQGPWRVYCDLETEGGGWMVFQVRDDVDPKENFMRGWEDYKVGFGDFDREFWLGETTSNVDNQLDQPTISLLGQATYWCGP